MKPECPIDWKTAFTAALLGFLGAYLIGGYLNMPDAGAIVAIAYVGGRILWYPVSYTRLTLPTSDLV